MEFEESYAVIEGKMRRKFKEKHMKFFTQVLFVD
jgi:hypothetical protein